MRAKPARDFASGEAAGEIPTRLFTNPLTALPLAFTASLPKQKLSRVKSRQLRRLSVKKLIKMMRFQQAQIMTALLDRIAVNVTLVVIFFKVVILTPMI